MRTVMMRASGSTQRECTLDVMADTERKPTPWRVEGAPPPDPEKSDGPSRPRFRFPGGRGFLVALLVLFAVNWYIGTQVNQQKTRVDVPYTTFRAQVIQSNVKEISTKGDTIQGKFRTAVKQGKTSSKDFDTVRPSFGDDGLLDLLINKNVVVNAQPVDEGSSFLVTLLISFGPDDPARRPVHLPHASRRGGGGGPVRDRSNARQALRRHAAANHVRRRGGHRRGRGRARRDRRLPQGPRTSTAASAR